MRYLILLLLALSTTACALTPDTVPEAQPGMSVAVVFDIDGTLTPDVMSMKTARHGAAEAVNAYADADFAIVYLTARVRAFQNGIPGWLEENGFPEGRIHVTETREDRKDHAAFKARVLQEYTDNGWSFLAAYGDSTSDFEAYAAAGIPRERVFALLRRGDENCQPGGWVACHADWPGQMEGIDALVRAGD